MTVSPPHIIFDREFYKLNLAKCVKNISQSHFLISEVSQNIAERIDEFSFSFPKTLIYGLYDEDYLPKRVTHITRGLLASRLAESTRQERNCIIFDEEHNIFGEGEFNLIISNLSLHMVNDVPGAIIQYKKSLAPQGVFIATLFGPDTLKELKDSFIKTDGHFYNGITPRVIPFIDIKDAAALLKRAGFNQVISDSYYIQVRYSDMMKMLYDIKAIGQNNCLINRYKIPPQKAYFSKLEEFYKASYDLLATFEIITMTGL